jgi:pimeloyl-ACP methyl ester carboxylesterase
VNTMLLILIPPLGHTSEFYTPLKASLGDVVDWLLPDYPYAQLPYTQLPARDDNDLLEGLAQHFLALIETTLASRPHVTRFMIGGVSLGATLSIRINHLLTRKPHRVLLMAPGGLRVSRARKDVIQMAIAQQSALSFVRQSLAIEGDTFLASSFPRQFCQLSPAVEAYWWHYARDFWRFGDNDAAAVGFLAMIQAALNVNFETHLAHDSANFLILWSANDKVFSMRMYRKFVDLATQADIRLLDNIGHYAPLEDPQRVATLILEAMSE